MKDALQSAQARFLAQATERIPPPAFVELRREATAAFTDRGLPTMKQEEWRHTNIAHLAGIEWAALHEPLAPPRSAIEDVATPIFACGLEVFIDGHHHPELHGSPGASEVETLGSTPAPPALLGRLADAKAHPFVALNGALACDGARVRVHGDDPRAVHLVFAQGSEDAASHPRVVIDAERGSRGTIILDHVSLAGARHFANSVVEVEIAEEASLDLVILQRAGGTSFHVGHVAGRVERNGRLRTHTISLGGRFVRNDLEVVLAGEGAECTMNGLYLGLGEGLIDNHTWVDHAVPHCTSHELYKGVLTGSARGVFRGRVVVRPDAQKSEATQSNPNLLLSDGAEIDTKPQLEIYANDVKCSHGAAIGRLDPESLFYLRSRGIGEDEARGLLTRGFAAEVLSALPEPSLAEAMSAVFLEKPEATGQRT
ncbi:MAG: Fe-S cluster assembly protein SufD [bacterium]|nr:Fe-S cluster assembly protein SufD [bacterium]